jgi:hypothetical protein
LHTITLALDDITQLFEEPEINPFAPNRVYTSGIRTILNELKPLSLNSRTRANILLPATQISPALQQQVKDAIERYCRSRIYRNEKELLSLRWRGLRALQGGSLFLAACLVLSALVENATFLPEFLIHFFSEGLIIAGWVSLWHPIEILLYEWWPYWRENRLLQHIMEMEMVIQPKQS